MNDIKLKKNKNNFYDITFHAGDVVNIEGNESLINACCIAILTALSEVETSTYSDFGSKAYNFVKKNKNMLVLRAIEDDTRHVLNNIRRVQSIDSLNVKSVKEGYDVNFRITSINNDHAQANIQIK